MNFKRLGFVLIAAIILAFGARFYLQQQASSVPRGSAVVYALQADGTAVVQMSERIYFSRPDVAQNFDSYLARLGDKPLSVETLASSMRSRTEALSKGLGRTMTAEDFAVTVEKTEEYGGRLSTFRWTEFASLEGDVWRIGFPASEKVTMNDHSSLTIVVPNGAELLSVEPSPDDVTGGMLVWKGPREMPWPSLQYTLE